MRLCFCAEWSKQRCRKCAVCTSLMAQYMFWHVLVNHRNIIVPYVDCLTGLNRVNAWRWQWQTFGWRLLMWFRKATLGNSQQLSVMHVGAGLVLYVWLSMCHLVWFRREHATPHLKMNKTWTLGLTLDLVLFFNIFIKSQSICCQVYRIEPPLIVSESALRLWEWHNSNFLHSFTYGTEVLIWRQFQCHLSAFWHITVFKWTELMVWKVFAAGKTQRRRTSQWPQFYSPLNTSLG